MSTAIFALSRCGDGQMHAFHVCDDDGEPVESPMCGSPSRSVDSGDDDTEVCDVCAQAIAVIISPDDPGEFLNAIGANQAN